MSVLFLKRTRRYAADKPILIKEPACTRGSKASLLRWLLQGPLRQEHRKAVQKPSPSRTALLARHTVRAAPESPASSPSLTARSPPSHLQTSSTTVLLQMEVAISCRLSLMTCHPRLSWSGNFSSSLMSARQHLATALQDLPCCSFLHL